MIKMDETKEHVLTESSSIDIEEIDGSLVMTVWSPKKCLITVALNEKNDRVHHRTVKFTRGMSGKDRQELVKGAITEVFL